MKSVICLLTLMFCAFSTDARPAAGPPYGPSGPPGNWWKAAVLEVPKGKNRFVKVKLTEIHGSCKYDSREGKVGEIYEVPVLMPRKFKVGETIGVWIAPKGKTSLHRPECQ